jgi:hypothetical protein
MGRARHEIVHFKTGVRGSVGICTTEIEEIVDCRS